MLIQPNIIMPQKPSLTAKVEGDSLVFGDCSLTFHRTLRIPEDGKTYPLPPSLGPFPLYSVDHYADKVPASWRQHGGIFLPMYQREAMWIQFHANSYSPKAVKIGVGKVNAISGKPWSNQLEHSNQDYVVIPQQPWIDGINSGDGTVKQFVAMPLGQGYTVEAQVTGEEKFGGIQIMVFAAKQNSTKIPKLIPQKLDFAKNTAFSCNSSACMAAPMMQDSLHTVEGTFLQSRNKKQMEMGIASGGNMKQKIYTDPHGYSEWDQSQFGRCYIHLVNSELFTEITGLPAPLTPIDAKLYASYNYPWFDIYDEHKHNVPKSNILSQVKTTHQIDESKPIWPKLPKDQTIPIYNVITANSSSTVRDGDWSVPSSLSQNEKDTVQVGDTSLVLTAEQKEKLNTLTSMGFEQKKTLKLMILHNWDMEKVLEVLL